MWVLKLDASGNIQWQKVYGRKSYVDIAFSIQQTSDGGYILAGVRDTNVIVNGGVFPHKDFWILKLNQNGDIQWQKIYDMGSNIENLYFTDDWAYSIWQTTDGGYVVAGETHPRGLYDYKIWILKLDLYGNIQWQKSYNGGFVAGIFRIGNKIQQTSDGGYTVVGTTTSFGAGGKDIWVLKLDSNGSIQWQKTYGSSGDEYAYSIQQTFDGGYIVAGLTSAFGAGRKDIWILKLDPNGDITNCPVIGSSSVTAQNTLASVANSSVVSSTANATVVNINTIESAVNMTFTGICVP